MSVLQIAFQNQPRREPSSLMQKMPPSTSPKRPLWVWGTLLSGCVLLFVLTWRLTLPAEPLSAVHFAKHKKQLEALCKLMHADYVQFRRGFFVDSEQGYTGEGGTLPLNHVALYKPLLQQSGIDGVEGNQDDNEVWFYNFKQNAGYAFIKGKPTPYDLKIAGYTALGNHWFLFRNR